MSQDRRTFLRSAGLTLGSALTPPLSFRAAEGARVGPPDDARYEVMSKFVAVVIGCCFVSPTYAQSDWRAVKGLSPGTRLRIESASGAHAKGLLQAVDDLQSPRGS